jgi:hypothetical protein
MQIEKEHKPNVFATLQKRKASIATAWYLYYFIWPFGSLIASLRNYRLPWSKNLFWLFCIYFGFVFVVAEDKYGSADSSRYAAQLEFMHSQSVNFENLLRAIYNPFDGYTDIYQPATTWLVSIFTDDPKWLFALFAMIFGYFYSRNIWLLLKSSKNKITWFAFLIILGFALVNPIWNINGVRMWTAAQIFIYGVLLYILKNEKIKGLLWIASTALVHFSFLFPISVFAVYIILPSYTLAFFLFFIITSFVNEINLFALRDSMSFLPAVFQPKVNAYTNVDYASSIAEQASKYRWHVKFAQLSGKIVIYSWVIIMFFNRKKWITSKPALEGLFLIALFIGGWANIASLVPSGGRFLALANLLFYASFFVYLMSYSKQINNHKPVILATILFLLFYIVFQFRVGFDYISYLIFIGNPILAYFMDEQTPLIHFIKELFN